MGRDNQEIMIGLSLKKMTGVYNPIDRTHQKHHNFDRFLSYSQIGQILLMLPSLKWEGSLGRLCGPARRR